MNDLEINNFIKTIKVEDISDFNLADLVIKRSETGSLVEASPEDKNLIEKALNLLSQIINKIKESYIYLKEHSEVIRTIDYEIRVLWSKVSPDIANILTGSARIYKNVAVFCIGFKQYSIDIIYNTQKEVISFVSDLFCLVVNKIFKPQPAPEF